MMSDAVPSDAVLADRFAGIAASVNADTSLRRRGCFLTTDVRVGIGTVPVQISIMAGEIVEIVIRPGLMRSWRFAIRGTGQAWHEFWKPTPRPGWHDLFALSKRGELTMEGDLQPFVANLQYFKDVLATPRRMTEL